MKHWILRNGRELGLWEEEVGQSVYYICDQTDTPIEIPFWLYQELDAAIDAGDGWLRFHYCCPKDPDVQQWLLFLVRSGVLRTGRIEREGAMWYLEVIRIGRRCKCLRPLCTVLIRLWPLAALVLVCWGMVLAFQYQTPLEGAFPLLPFFFLVFLSAIFHEIGHMVGIIAAGLPIREIGAYFFGPFPLGLYVADGYWAPEQKWDKIRMLLAGPLANWILSGVYYWLLSFYPPWEDAFWTAGWISLFFCPYNLLPFPQSDGAQVLSTLFEVDSLADEAHKVLRSPQKTAALRQLGWGGKVVFYFLKWVFWVDRHSILAQGILVGGFTLFFLWISGFFS